ncbi:MvaI/BcnI restriction endonuclease family protein [Marinobacter sp. es.048]|uniref:MvaI/BcnI family restriction endonuclease n=1 Tax=Marinobacter sp. es.048 TaxID=1761795 RepID=UPI000B593F64|nr:MvaI/BcnI family restriction endonuclease [Marinobacter sp. es.048]SNC59212.1 MvaI/BcnI restriction endonuclease family protein [Marinobacter sp. es.048]
MSKNLLSVFVEPEKIEGIFCKVLTNNDDAGRHGVLIPEEGYKLFPKIAKFTPGVPENFTESIRTIWPESGTTRESCYKHYHRYPERRLTRLDPALNTTPTETLLVIGKRTDGDRFYELHIIPRGSESYYPLLEDLGLSSEAGAFLLDLEWSSNRTKHGQTEAVKSLLSQFDKIKSEGYLRTLRAGSTGIGFTFETLIGIEENNDSGPDFMGIELKCHRLKKGPDTGVRNLFLKAPTWIDGSKNRLQRLERYGYEDAKRNRRALFSKVSSNANSHGLQLVVSENEESVYLTYQGTQVAKYSFKVLDFRLSEKVTEIAFIGATSRNKGDQEEFSYQTLTYYQTPSIKQFISLIDCGDVHLELRMHDKKDYGCCFRIKESKLTELYARVEHLREKD